MEEKVGERTALDQMENLVFIQQKQAGYSIGKQAASWPSSLTAPDQHTDPVSFNSQSLYVILQGPYRQTVPASSRLHMHLHLNECPFIYKWK